MSSSEDDEELNAHASEPEPSDDDEVAERADAAAARAQPRRYWNAPAEEEKSLANVVVSITNLAGEKW